MANRPQQLDLLPPRTYTRTDFAALRVYVQRVSPATIMRLYFDPEAPHAASGEHADGISDRCATTSCSSHCCTARQCLPIT